jgi:hypothetical protein
LRRSLDPPLLKVLVESLVLSRIDYCISVLGGLPRRTTDRLGSVLKASARVIYGVDRFAPVSDIVRELRWLPIEARVHLRLVALAHSCLHGKAPSYLSEELKIVSSMPGRSRLRSATTRALVIPRVRCPTLGGRSFHARAATLWNALPPSATLIEDSKRFKEAVKCSFFT